MRVREWGGGFQVGGIHRGIPGTADAAEPFIPPSNTTHFLTLNLPDLQIALNPISPTPQTPKPYTPNPKTLNPKP